MTAATSSPSSVPVCASSCGCSRALSRSRIRKSVLPMHRQPQHMRKKRSLPAVQNLAWLMRCRWPSLLGLPLFSACNRSPFTLLQGYGSWLLYRASQVSSRVSLNTHLPLRPLPHSRFLYKFARNLTFHSQLYCNCNVPQVKEAACSLMVTRPSASASASATLFIAFDRQSSTAITPPPPRSCPRSHWCAWCRRRTRRASGRCMRYVEIMVESLAPLCDG